uniref:Uncharacterized protein n=1 Tax=Cannabis sativa TaxID=3483 RepID=A0A803Q6I4_CANSA
MEQNHREALKARDEVISTVRRDLRDSKEEVQELTAKLKSLGELHETDLETIVKLTVEVKELLTCQHCRKHFDDGVFMCWTTNDYNLRLPFYPKPREVLVRFQEKKKRLDAVLEERTGPHLPPQAD